MSIPCTVFFATLSLLAIGALPQTSGDAASTPCAGQPEVCRLVGITIPSARATLASVIPARIAAIPADEGDLVQKADVVVALDDRIQMVRTEIAKATAQSTVEMELSRVRREHARREWERLVSLYGNDYASSTELNDAHAEADQRRLEYELTQFAHEQAVRAYEREQKQLEEYTLRAPFSGFVTQHHKHPGETVDQLEGIVTLVQLDPIHVIVDCPTYLASVVALGAEARVWPADRPSETRAASVVFVSRVADGGSQTFKIKLSIPNKVQDWLAGLKVVVDLAEPRAQTAASRPGEDRSHGGEAGHRRTYIAP